MLKMLKRNILICLYIIVFLLLSACGNKASQIFDPQNGNETSGNTDLPVSDTGPSTEIDPNTDPIPPKEPNPNAGIVLGKDFIELMEGETEKLNATVIPAYTNDSTKLTFSCDSKCVLVDEEGNITALKVGEATVTLTTSAGLTASVRVVVTPKPNPNASLTLDKNDVILNVDDTLTLGATYIPSFDSDDMTLCWESDNKQVVTVDANGKLKALNVGQSTITCTSADGNFSDSCTVTVKLMWKNYAFAFKTDLSSYEWVMNPESDAYVFLVNKDNPLAKNFAPDDLVDIRDTRTDRAKQKMRKIAEAALHALYLEAEANGFLYVHKQLYSDGYYYNNVLSVTSAYRTYAQQEYNFNNKVNSILKENPSYSKAQAEAIAATTINRPGTSEHQSGLCVDMHNYRYAEKEIAKEFGESVAGKWLAENCYKFGFILRYEEDKTDITGIAYESWHFRYVGRYHATRMHELDMCLEEYTVYLEKMGYEFDLTE